VGLTLTVFNVAFSQVISGGGFPFALHVIANKPACPMWNTNSNFSLVISGLIPSVICKVYDLNEFDTCTIIRQEDFYFS